MFACVRRCSHVYLSVRVCPLVSACVPCVCLCPVSPVCSLCTRVCSRVSRLSTCAREPACVRNCPCMLTCVRMCPRVFMFVNVCPLCPPRVPEGVRVCLRLSACVAVCSCVSTCVPCVRMCSVHGETFFYQTHTSINREMHLQNLAYRQIIFVINSSSIANKC